MIKLGMVGGQSYDEWLECRRHLATEPGKGFSGPGVHLERAYHTAHIAAVNFCCRVRVGSDKFLIYRIDVSLTSQFFYIIPEFGVGRNPRHLPAFQHGADIQAGAPHQEWQAAPPENVPDGPAGYFEIDGQAEIIIGVNDIDEVMGNGGQFLRGRLGRADIQVAVDLPAIGADDFAGEMPGQPEGQAAFTDAGGADDGDQTL